MAKLHGLCRRSAPQHPLFRTWCDMRYRCENPEKDNFAYYGGRGIKVCDRWKDFGAFVADMGERPEGMTLDRIDPDGDYAPENCRWAAKITQANNTRSNVYLQFNGATKTLSEWSRETGLEPGTIQRRLKHSGWSIEKALTTPARGWAPGRPRG